MDFTSDKFVPALYGGLFIATVWTVPGLNFLNACCCGGVILGGFLAVLIYQRQVEGEGGTLTKEDCVQLGMMTGIVSAVAGAVMQYITTLLFGSMAVDLMLAMLDRMQADIPPSLMTMVEEGKNAEPSIIGAFFSAFVYAVPGILFSYLGALLGWRVFGPKEE